MSNNAPRILNPLNKPILLHSHMLPLYVIPYILCRTGRPCNLSYQSYLEVIATRTISWNRTNIPSHSPSANDTELHRPCGIPDAIQTHDLQIRSLLFYSTELLGHMKPLVNYMRIALMTS